MRNRRPRRRRRLTVGRIARYLACAAATLFLAVWAVRMAAVDAFVRPNPFLAAAIAPAHPRPKMAVAIAEFTVRNGRVSAATRNEAIDALKRSALSEEPFLLTGVQAIADGDPARGRKLLEESRRRNPRSRLTRLLLLDGYLRRNQLEEAGVEIQALTRIIPEAGAVIGPQLAQMAQDPKTGEAVVAMLRRDPTIRDSVLAELAKSGGRTDLILRIAGAGPAAAGAEWQRILLARLVAGGDVAGARRLWQRFGGGAAAPGIYDSDFAGRPGLPPFNWELASGGEGVAERIEGPALQVDYYGRGGAWLARQLLMLPPGGYKLQFRAQGDAKGQASRLSWNLACAGSKAVLLQIPLVGIRSSPRMLSGAFTIPSGCAAQWLSLDGTPGDVPSEESVTISGLRLQGGAAR